MSRARLHLSGAAPREVEVRGPRVSLGRSDDCDVMLEEEGVSRHHADLIEDAGGWVIQDAGSRNGTFVNDEPASRRRLKSGDIVRLGALLEFEFEPLETADRDSERAAAPEDEYDESPEEAAPAPRATGRAAARPGKAPGGKLPSPFHELRFLLLPLGGRERRPIALSAAVTTVGRDPGAGLTLDDDSISRMHARLDREGESLFVTDLKSRNGTAINGEPVLRAPVRPGDRVSFGNLEFELARRAQVSWKRVGVLAGAIAVLLIVAVVVLRLDQVLGANLLVSAQARRVHSEAVTSVRKGIDAYRGGELDFAHAYFVYAADLLMLSGLAPRGSSLERPDQVFRPILRELPEADRNFDFVRALDPKAIEAARAKLQPMTERQFVDYMTKRIAVELGLDEGVPAGFAEEVWRYVQEYGKYHGIFQGTLRRSRVVQPRIRKILEINHLPEIFSFVAWVESDLDSTKVSPVGARGLWQFMASTGRRYGLRVDEGVDERTSVTKSTRAASRYIGDLLLIFGREQFMCALASYNRGETGVQNQMKKIPDPMMESSKKFWYLVEHGLLPPETSGYVPKIFAARIVAEDPARFGYERP